MATPLLSPYPPAPPRPPASRSNWFLIALLLLVIIVVGGIMAVWVGLHVLTHAVRVHVNRSGGSEKHVSIRTPLASIEVNKGINEASLGLPIYPGATPLKDDDSATVSLDFGNAAGLRIRVCKFVSRDPINKVRDFYHSRLGAQVTRYQERDSEGKTVFEIKQSNEKKVVALKDERYQTVIELVSVSGAKGEAN